MGMVMMIVIVVIVVIGVIGVIVMVAVVGMAMIGDGAVGMQHTTVRQVRMVVVMAVDGERLGRPADASFSPLSTSPPPTSHNMLRHRRVMKTHP